MMQPYRYAEIAALSYPLRNGFRSPSRLNPCSINQGLFVPFVGKKVISLRLFHYINHLVGGSFWSGAFGELSCAIVVGRKEFSATRVQCLLQHQHPTFDYIWSLIFAYSLDSYYPDCAYLDDSCIGFKMKTRSSKPGRFG